MIQPFIPTIVADKQERAARLRSLIACLQHDVDTQMMSVQVRRESIERIARWTLAANALGVELVKARGY